MKRRLPDPLDPDEAWATPDTFQQCGNPGCCCNEKAEPTDKADIE